AGIGPEIVLKALRERPALRRQAVVLGDMASLRRAARVIGGGADSARQGLVLAGLEGLSSWGAQPPGAVAVLQAGEALQSLPPIGEVSAEAGRAAAAAIRLGAQAVLQGRARALVTAPIHKEALAAAGEPFPGHTELLQALAAQHQGLKPQDVPVR